MPTETKATHTPGPWEIADMDPPVFCKDIYDTRGPAGGLLIACVAWYDKPGIGSANARLIASAPDLLAMLKQLVVERNFRVYMPDVLQTEVESLIAKAEGR